MELDKLLSEVSESVSENLALKKSQETLIEEITDKVNDNFKRLFLPEVKKLWEFACNVNKETGIYTSLNKYSTSEWNNKCETKEFMSISIQYDSYYNNCSFVSKSGHSWSVSEGKGKNASCFNCWEGLVTNFNTEEATLKTLESAKKDFAEYFEKFSALLRGQNEKLSEKVLKLRDVLNNSSSVKQCENGTVEINIGGKTYIGTLKEES